MNILLSEFNNLVGTNFDQCVDLQNYLHKLKICYYDVKFKYGKLIDMSSKYINIYRDAPSETNKNMFYFLEIENDDYNKIIRFFKLKEFL